MEAEQIDRKRYEDRSGKSGVLEYALGRSSMYVWFVDGSGYLYDDGKPGLRHVEEMKRRAEKGTGLATYINQHVRANFARKL